MGAETQVLTYRAVHFDFVVLWGPKEELDLYLISHPAGQCYVRLLYHIHQGNQSAFLSAILNLFLSNFKNGHISVNKNYHLGCIWDFEYSRVRFSKSHNRLYFLQFSLPYPLTTSHLKAPQPCKMYCVPTETMVFPCWSAPLYVLGQYMTLSSARWPNIWEMVLKKLRI